MRPTEENSQTIIPILTGEDNYPSWKRDMWLVLAKHKLLGYISKETSLKKEIKDDQTPDLIKTGEIDHNAMIASYYIMNGLQEKLKDEFSEYIFEPSKLWQSIEEKYDKKGAPKIMELYFRMTELSIRKNDIQTYNSEFEAIRLQLTRLRACPKGLMLILNYLHGLNSNSILKRKAMKMMLKMEEDSTLEEVKTEIMNHYRAEIAIDGHPKVSANAATKEKKWCTHHNSSTHNTLDCWTLKKAKKLNPTEDNNNSVEDGNPNKTSQVYSSWLIDSAATDHMTGNEGTISSQFQTIANHLKGKATQYTKHCKFVTS